MPTSTATRPAKKSASGVKKKVAAAKVPARKPKAAATKKSASSAKRAAPKAPVAVKGQKDVLTDDGRKRLAYGGVKAIKSGRTTSAVIGDGDKSASAQVHSLFGQYADLGYMLPWETLDYVELLATFNPDYSQAVENIKMLANSGHKVFVKAGSKGRTKKVKKLIEEKARLIQESHGGIDGVIDKLLDQAATFGAMCGEWVLSDDLKEVVDFVDISPKVIRFFWEKEEQRWCPYQKVTPRQAEEAKASGQKTMGPHVKLNETTFRYYAFDAAPGSPYGTPPFLAALANIAIQRDIVHNMAQIVKKIGILGIIDLKIESLKPLPQESDEDYARRAGQYLEEYIEVAEDMAREGGFVHYADVEAKTWQIGGNAAGATNIHKANEEMVFSGLKSMPSVQGRSYSTTETYAGVAYEIILRNTWKYQRATKRMIESGYWLMVTLEMPLEPPDEISLKFSENRSLNRLTEAQAEKTELLNDMLMWLCGLIDQQEVGQRHGINEPKTEMDTPPEAITGTLTAHAVSEYGMEQKPAAKEAEEKDSESDPTDSASVEEERDEQEVARDGN